MVRWTTRNRLLTLLIIIFLCATAFMIQLTNHYMSMEITGRSMTYFSAMVNQVALRIDTYIQQSAHFVELLSTRNRMMYLLTDIASGKLDLNVNSYKIVREVLNMNPWDISSLEGVYLFPIGSNTPINCYYREPMSEIDAYSELILGLRKKEATLWDGYQDEGDRLTAYRLLFSSKREKIGLLKVVFSKDYIHGILDEVPSGEGMIMMCADQYERVICANDRELIRSTSPLLTKKEHQTITVKLQNGWQLMGVIPTSRITKDISNYIFIFASAFLGIFLLMFAIIAWYSNRLLNPVRLIMGGMDRVNRGDFSVRLAYTGNQEFDVIVHTFNKMVEAIKAQTRTIYKQQKLNYEARMNALQAQKDPHFLYNMLDAIYWMAYSMQQHEIARITLALAKMLRYSITNAGTFVTIKGDMEQIGQYLEVMQARFVDKLEYEISYDPALSELRIPIFLLQPLVENAINHGLKELGRSGKVLVTGAFHEDGGILFVVEDDGVGFQGNSINEDGSVRCEGVGLRLVRECIEYNYGEPYGMHIESSEGRTVCTVYIGEKPMVIVEEADE